MGLYSTSCLGHILDEHLSPYVLNFGTLLLTAHAHFWLQTLFAMIMLALVYYYVILPMNYVKVSCICVVGPFHVYNIICYELCTNPMVQSPSLKANSHLFGQEILCFLWNLKVHYLIHRSPPQVPILSQMKPVHNFELYFSEIPSNIILPSTSRSSSGLFLSGFLT
jgi:hypothetical protein